jgi:hypothetical protein
MLIITVDKKNQIKYVSVAKVLVNFYVFEIVMKENLNLIKDKYLI